MGNASMADWVKTTVGLVTIIGAVAGGLMYFAKDADLQTLVQRFDRSEINQEMLFQKKVIMMLRDKCEANRCNQEERICYEEARHRLDELRDEKARLKAK